MNVRRGNAHDGHRTPPEVRTGTGAETEIVPPENCPSCDGPLTEVGESRILQCENVQGCAAQKLRRLVHWASRTAADIDAIGETWIERFCERGLLESPADFYRLTKDDLLGFDGMGERLAAKMLGSIERSKRLGLRKAVIGLAIPLASEGTAKRLCRAGYRSLEQVMAAPRAELLRVDDVGAVVADSILRFFSLPANRTLVEALRALGVSLDVLPADEPITTSAKTGAVSALAGKTIVVSGQMAVERKAVEAQLERTGATCTGSVSGKTDYLIAGPGAGSKLARAEALGIPVLTESQALEFVSAELRWV